METLVDTLLGEMEILRWNWLAGEVTNAEMVVHLSRLLVVLQDLQTQVISEMEASEVVNLRWVGRGYQSLPTKEDQALT